MAAGDPYEAVGGTLVTPLGVIKVTGGQVRKRALKVRNITGPGDNGNVTYIAGNYTYSASLSGVYVEGGASETLDTTTTGTLTVPIGNGETWSGQAIITNLVPDVDWEGGGEVPVAFQALWSGAVTVS